MEGTRVFVDGNRSHERPMESANNVAQHHVG